MQYVLITSVDVERSISLYKVMLRSNRHHFKCETKLYVVYNCFLHKDFMDDSE